MAGSKRQKLKAIISPSPPPGPAQDDDLLDDLLAELDSRSPQVQAEAATLMNDIEANKAVNSPPIVSEKKTKSSKERFRERGARKAIAILEAQPESDPALEARLQREATDEETSIAATCKTLHLRMHEIPPDGHCLFSAVADQLHGLGILPEAQAHYQTTRHAAALFMYTHPDDFIPFLPSVDGEDGAGATDETGLMTPVGFKKYCAAIRDTGVWGGEPEILALAKAYKVPIHVVQSGPPTVVVHSPVHGAPASPDAPIVYISYHRRMYGLGEHYNSLRPKSRGLGKIMEKLDERLS